VRRRVSIGGLIGGRFGQSPVRREGLRREGEGVSEAEADSCV